VFIYHFKLSQVVVIIRRSL